MGQQPDRCFGEYTLLNRGHFVLDGYKSQQYGDIAIQLHYKQAYLWLFPNNSGFTLVSDPNPSDFIGTDIRFSSTSTSVELCDAQISIGSCSTQPGLG